MVRKYISALLLLMSAATLTAQQGQSVHLVQGNSVILRADATNARSYLWFRDGEPINGFHDQRLTVAEAGTYTVMALGNDCNSDMSDPVEVTMDADGGGPVTVDMHIRNTPDQPTVLVGSTFSYQLFVVNNGAHIATGVTVKAVLPQQVLYESIIGSYAGQTAYNAPARELTWLPGDIAPGQSQTLTIGVRAESEGNTSQLAIVASSETDTNPADNEAVAMVEIIALSIPNTFTPNGDGLNDQFRIRGLELFPENRIVIFNRWGNEVFKASPYKGDWDGGGLAEGTYYYAFECRLHTGRWQTFKGFITIIRTASN
ncbi:conserved repeat domain-containing protein/gliding motility-associated C-terminal domain-containing protein [Parapedobacter composti]|uniref:Conserved repeat domain-containing protein/gliding motility-associated C-terminal domain-containing protein n=1 Tax=Parapedobacter composti TaxID=623281 RepID=A0A1I1GNZ6_9SPHI|nr:gliding motility-associated C-terminal domain-containing protein [Parapedobacter composti]SFC13216.1 conserved repeat domain-containing protein/gliding motility-associated C-terminal domain-containing protein [Parapedobacter composti]